MFELTCAGKPGCVLGRMDESVLQPQQGYYLISINRRPVAHTFQP